MSRVAVIDADGPARDHFTRVLQSAGHETVAFASSGEALEAIAAEPPDLVLVEMGMPDVDGFEVVRALRRLPETFNKPVVLTSAVYSAAQLYDIGVVSPRCVLLPKPATPQSILSAVSAALDEPPPHGPASSDVLQRLSRAEERDRESRAMFESARDCLLVVDLELRCVRANRAACDLIGATREELAGMLPVEVVAPESRRDFESDWAEALRTGGSQGQLTIVRRGGDRRRIEHTTTANIVPGFHLVALRDVTERVQMEQTLRGAMSDLEVSERRYVELIEALPNGVVAVDADGLILLVNDQTERMFGYLRGELIGRPFELLLPERLRAAHVAHRAGFSDTFRSRMMDLDPDLRGRRKDGGEFPIEVSLSACETDQGYVVTGVISDVTDRKELEAQLVHSQKLEALGRLAGGIAHDFNNLLQVISGYGESLEGRLVSGPEAAELSEIRTAADRAASLTKQLLAFSRRQVVEPRPLDLNLIVTEMEQMLARVIGEDVALSIDLEPELWPVNADEAQLEQVLANLAVNARDAMPSGGRLSVSTRNVVLNGDAGALGLDPGEYVRLIVEDTGCGMDSETVAHAFEPFYTTKGDGKGTGLGLATVQGIVSQGDGRVLIESVVGRGTQIISYLPSTREAAVRIPEAPPSQDVTCGIERILLVEDEPVVRQLFQALLGRLGYDVTAVACGADAVAAFAATDGFDVVVTDLVMPGMSGRELVARLEVAGTALPVLFISGFAPDAIVETGLDGPRSSFLQKPFTGDELARRIRTLLDAPETL